MAVMALMEMMAVSGVDGAYGVVGQGAVSSTSSSGPTLPAKDLSLPLARAEPLCVQNDQACRHNERKYFSQNDVINQVKLTKMTHIRKRQTSKRWIPSQIKENVLTSNNSEYKRIIPAMWTGIQVVHHICVGNAIVILMDMSKKEKKVNLPNHYRDLCHQNYMRPKQVKTYTDAVDGFPRYWRRKGEVTGKRIVHRLPIFLKVKIHGEARHYSPKIQKIHI